MTKGACRHDRYWRQGEIEMLIICKRQLETHKSHNMLNFLVFPAIISNAEQLAVVQISIAYAQTAV